MKDFEHPTLYADNKFFHGHTITILIEPRSDFIINFYDEAHKKKLGGFVLISKGTLSELIDFKCVRGNVILLTITLKDC